jgi:hypothetical protein
VALVEEGMFRAKSPKASLRVEEAAEKLDFLGQQDPAGAKAQQQFEAFTARLKSCPDAFS